MNLLPPSRYFPPAEDADAEGLVAVGGELSPIWLMDAYRHGIFPWPVNDRLLAWWSPDPRAVLEFDDLYISRRLARTIRRGTFEVTCNQDFRGVIEGCATAPGRVGHTWITPEMRAAYRRLNRLHCAHSVEVWREGRLVGGTYGVSSGGLFAAESMFHLENDASKVALAYLIGHLHDRGFAVLDIQQLTEHTRRMGGSEISRSEYLRRLRAALECDVTFGNQLQTDWIDRRVRARETAPGSIGSSDD